MMGRHFQRQLSSLVLIVLMATGCARAVEIPREQFEAASQDQSASHRIRMKDGAEYVARRFSLTDSTVVVSELSPADSQYRLAQLPITLWLNEVESVAELKSNPWVPVAALITGFALVALGITFAGSFAASD